MRGFVWTLAFSHPRPTDIEKTIDSVLRRLAKHALARGGNAVVNLQLRTSSVGGMVMVLAYGMAVRVSLEERGVRGSGGEKPVSS